MDSERRNGLFLESFTPLAPVTPLPMAHNHFPVSPCAFVRVPPTIGLPLRGCHSRCHGGSMGLRKFDEKFLVEFRFSSSQIQNSSYEGPEGQECVGPVTHYLDRSILRKDQSGWFPRGFYCRPHFIELRFDGVSGSYLVKIRG